MKEWKTIFCYLYQVETVNPLKLLANYLLNVDFRIHILLHRYITTSNKLLKYLYYNRLKGKYGIVISMNCKIGRRIQLMHHQGIVIGDGVTIGDDCKLYQQVTLGQKDGVYPKVGNNVIIYPGAKVIGDIVIEDNAVIGANAVVMSNVPANSVVAGIPAKIVKKE